MLRINLMHDAATDPAAVPERATALLYVVGALIVALCGCVAAAGWILLDGRTTEIRTEHRELRASVAARDSRPAPPADRAPLVALQRATFTLEAAAQQRTVAPAAVQRVFEILELDNDRAENLTVHALQFDGHIFRVSGTAADATTIQPLLEQLQAERGLRDARFTSLRAAEPAEAPKRRRGRSRDQPVGIDFSLYATLHAAPFPAVD